MLYRIHWKSKLTGLEEHNANKLTYAEAQAWIGDLEKEYPDIRHWIEPIEEAEHETQDNRN